MRPLFDRLPGQPLPGIALALGAFALALASRFALNDWLPQGFPFLTFFPAVILTAFLAGTWPGTLCALLSGLAAWFFFIAPFDSWAINGAGLLAMLFFASIVAIDIVLIHLMFRSNRWLQAEQATTAALYDQQRTMFQELQHRTANSLAFVASLLSLERQRVARDPGQAEGVFDAAIARIDTIARAHRRLYDPAAIDQPLGAFITVLARDVLDSAGIAPAALSVQVAPPLTLDLQRRMTVSLLLTELITNSIKHGLAGRHDPQLAISLMPSARDEVTLVVQDNGPGFGEGFRPLASQGLGTRIVTGFVSQLGGSIHYSSNGGARVAVRFPIHAGLEAGLHG